MDNPLPAWAYSAYWLEHKKDSKAYYHRLADFKRMVNTRGIPVVFMQDGQVTGVEFASPKDCDKTVDFGHSQSPDPQIVCAYCEQHKKEYEEFLKEVATAKREKRVCAKHTNTSALIRTISPNHPHSCVDCDYGSNWVWAKCVHVQAWKLKEETPEDKKTNRFGDG